MEEGRNNLFMNPSLMQYNAVLNQGKENSDKLAEFLERIAPFEQVETLQDAKELAAKILPTSTEINRFYIGDAKCTIVNNAETFRVCVDSPAEFLCYDFA